MPVSHLRDVTPTSLTYYLLHIINRQWYNDVQADCVCGEPDLSSFPDHDIVIVAISNAQHIGSYTVASTGQRELLYCLFKFVPGEKNSQKWGKNKAQGGDFDIRVHLHFS